MGTGLFTPVRQGCAPSENQYPPSFGLTRDALHIIIGWDVFILMINTTIMAFSLYCQWNAIMN